MAREARKLSSTGMYFIKLTGETLFKTEEDKSVFIEMLEKYFAEGEIYGYDLSEKEIRLVVKEAPKGISMTMKPLTTSYARYFNRTHNIAGKLFHGRFISIPIEREEEKREFLDSLKEPVSNRTKGTVKRNGDTKTIHQKNTGDTKPIKEKAEAPKPSKEAAKPSAKKKMPSYLL